MPSRSTLVPLRRQLDTKLLRFTRHAAGLRPRGGWIRTIRESLGMTLRQLSRRMGVKHSVVARAEQRERTGAISLEALRRAAEAMDCDLVYFFLPRQGLQATVQAQAMRVAETLVGTVSHSMDLEAQLVDARERQRQVRDVAAELVRQAGSRIWDEETP
jgi:predicted DNA-binding mobile mystery protein A